MKKLNRMFMVTLVLIAMFLSACGAASAVKTNGSVNAVGNGKGNASPVEFTGVIESMNGNQWIVNGQVITVAPATIKDGPFNVGDVVKVETQVQTDGSVVSTRVETAPAPIAGSTNVPVAPSSIDDSLSSSEDSSTPDPVMGDPTGDEGNNEIFGTVNSFDGTTIVIDGQSYTVANGAEIKGTITAGSFVKVELISNPDGTLSIQQIQLSDPAAATGDHSNSNGTGGSSNSGSGSNVGSGSHDQNDDANHDQNDDNGNDGSGHDQNDDNGGSDG